MDIAPTVRSHEKGRQGQVQRRLDMEHCAKSGLYSAKATDESSSKERGGDCWLVCQNTARLKKNGRVSMGFTLLLRMNQVFQSVQWFGALGRLKVKHR